MADLGVLETVRRVVTAATWVTIDQEALEGLSRELAQKGVPVPPWHAPYHYADGTLRTAYGVLVLDALNFCFWPQPLWQVEYRAEWVDGYWALAASLKRALEEGVPLDRAEFLASCSEEELRRIFRGRGEVPLFPERLHCLREVGRVLGERYRGDVSLLLAAARGSAVGLVLTLVRDFPSFRDEALYQGETVRFYKRAQLLAADLYGAFGGQGPGAFFDLDQLTAFADYRLPQVLRALGVLRYRGELAELVDAQVPLPDGSPEEVEIRANTVWAVELLRRRLAEEGVHRRAFEIDWYLWNRAQSPPWPMQPHHRTRSISY